jgi:hypothetical protein
MDCLEKRGKKGYLFIIGDEMSYNVNPREVNSIIGVDLGESISVEAIFAELKKKFEVFYILPQHTQYAGDPEVLGFWRKLLGENVFELDNPDAVCELIALTIGVREGAVDVTEGAEHLKEIGTDLTTIGVVTKALATVGAGAGNAVAKSDGSLSDIGSGDSIRSV